MKKIAVVQSNYIPWKGYFDMIAAVDEFILFDHAQYTKNDWRNRNRIKTPKGTEWITIPVVTAGRFGQRICDVETVSPSEWAEKHWKTIEQHYRRAPFFAEYREQIQESYLGLHETNLSRINYLFIELVCDIIGIGTQLSCSMDYILEEGKTERLVSLCQTVGADHYFSGPSAHSYIVPELFSEAGITIEYMDYSDYPEYSQLYTGFEHKVTILDLIFNVGPEAPYYMKHVRQ